MLLLVPLSLAAEPGLEGVRLAIGAGFGGSLGFDGVVTSHLGSGLRLHIARTVLIDVAGGFSWVNVDSADDTRALDDEGASYSVSYDHDVSSGPAGAIGLRVGFPVNRGSPVSLAIGVQGVYEASSMTGTASEEDDAGEPKEIGTFSTREREIGVGPSLTATYWLTDRVSLSGLVDANVWTIEERHETLTRTDGDVDFDADQEDDVSTAFGVWPHIGLYVHLLL